MNNMKLLRLKAGGIDYKPQPAGEPIPGRHLTNFPVCIIKKLMFGRWQIDYFDEDYQSFETKTGYRFFDEDKPNKRLIIYPSGVEEVEYHI